MKIKDLKIGQLISFDNWRGDRVAGFVVLISNATGNSRPEIAICYKNKVRLLTFHHFYYFDEIDNIKILEEVK